MISLNSKLLKTMFKKGAKIVENNFEYINELNVFPVPDGDTGINLKITTSGAYDSISDLETEDIALLTKTFARGLLMNARGNSGVIFSQIFKGFSSVFKPGQNEASLSDLVKAFRAAKDYAYRSVATPIEGTILTVIRVTAEKLIEADGTFKSVEDLFAFALKESKIILDKTPEFLVQLKEVGVVDSGGYGLMCFLDGMHQAISAPETEESKVEVKEPSTSTRINKNFVDNNEGFGYCSEFIMKLGSKVTVDQPDKESFDEAQFKDTIRNMGDCFVYVKDEDLVKVHVHVVKPYDLLAYASRFGEFTKVKIENMTMQFLMKNKNTTLEKAQAQFNIDNEITNETRIVATVPSAAVQEVYEKQFGIKHVINCDQIGNPSIQQFYDLIKSAKSKNVLVITDNGNILMAAEQAAKLFHRNTCNIRIIPAKDIATSYLCCLSYNPELNLDDNVKNIFKFLKNVGSGKISRAVKNITYKNSFIRIDDYLAVINKDIIANSKQMEIVSRRLIDDLFGRVKKIRTCVVIYGKDATMEQVNKVVKYINEKYLIKPIVIQGNQSTYHFYVGVSR